MSDLLIIIFTMIAFSILVALVLERKDIQIRSLKTQNKRLDEVATYWHTHTFRIERELAELKEKQRILDDEDYVYEITENDYNEFKTLKEENEKLKLELDFAKHLEKHSYNKAEEKLKKIEELVKPVYYDFTPTEFKVSNARTGLMDKIFEIIKGVSND